MLDRCQKKLVLDRCQIGVGWEKVPDVNASTSGEREQDFKFFAPHQY